MLFQAINGQRYHETFKGVLLSRQGNSLVPHQAGIRRNRKRLTIVLNVGRAAGQDEQQKRVLVVLIGLNLGRHVAVGDVHQIQTIEVGGAQGGVDFMPLANDVDLVRIGQPRQDIPHLMQVFGRQNLMVFQVTHEQAPILPKDTCTL